MASCAQVDSLAQAYVDGELNPSETLVFEQHLGECRQCAHQLDRQRAAAAMLFDSFADHRMPRSLVPDIMAHLPEIDDARLVRQVNARLKSRPDWSRWFFAALMPVVAVLVLTLAGVIFFGLGPQRLEKTVTAQAIGMVTFLTGHVTGLMPQETQWKDLDTRALISRDQLFATEQGSAMIASVAGPSMIKVAEGSRLKVNDDRRVALQSGKIWLHVAKSAKGARVFRVHSPDGNITVFGTTFGVEVLEGRTIVTLLEGEVTVENDLTFATLRPNEQIELKRGVSPLQPYTVDAAQALAWADAIQPDGVAQGEFLSTIHPLGETILRAENVWRVDTGEHTVSNISFSWNPAKTRDGLCSYVVYVTDDAGRPLFVGRIEARDLAQQGRTQVELSVPNDALKPNTTAFIRMVPDTTTGAIETDFDEVAFVGT